MNFKVLLIGTQKHRELYYAEWKNIQTTENNRQLVSTTFSL